MYILKELPKSIRLIYKRGLHNTQIGKYLLKKVVITKNMDCIRGNYYGKEWGIAQIHVLNVSIKQKWKHIGHFSNK